MSEGASVMFIDVLRNLSLDSLRPPLVSPLAGDAGTLLTRVLSHFRIMTYKRSVRRASELFCGYTDGESNVIVEVHRGMANIATRRNAGALQIPQQESTLFGNLLGVPLST